MPPDPDLTVIGKSTKAKTLAMAPTYSGSMNPEGSPYFEEEKEKNVQANETYKILLLKPILINVVHRLKLRLIS